MPKIPEEKIQISPKRLRVYKVLCIFLIISVSAAVSINYYIIRTAGTSLISEISNVPKKDYCLLLGARPGSYAMDYRIDAAFELYSKGKVKHILISGDNGRQIYNEPEEIRAELVRRGVPREAMTLDYAGFRTYDSVYRALHVFGVKDVVIVTQEFHAARALFLARSMDIEGVAYMAAPTIARNFNRLRESLARIRAFADVLFRLKPKFPGPPEPIELATLLGADEKVENLQKKQKN